MGFRYLVLAGCLSSSSAQAPAPQAQKRTVMSKDRKQIEKAYAARDTQTLHEMLDLVTDHDDVALAREYYVKLELDALTALDCDAFIAAFQPIKQRANPKTEFGALTTDF